jgi:hypothetical protein
MRAILALLIMLLAISSLHAEVFTGENENQPFTIRGRLSCYNGSATLRIWIIGSNRMLYVDGETTPALERVNQFFGDGEGWFTRQIFANFTVAPLAPDVKGHMRPVRILAIKDVVITKEGKVIAKRNEL